VRKSLFAIFFLIFCLAVTAQQAMNNDSIVKMVKAGLSDDLIVSTINASAGAYNTSADGIIALKTAGVSDKVVAAVVAKASAPAVPAVTPPPAPLAPVSTLPPGIDDVGVYYKDKTGAWAPLLPEIVNFKTGGVLKSIATDGLVKGDLNGHIQGERAKNSATFPLVLAVYVPEGTAITEYQLLRLRTNHTSREFRSVTGGVMHVSGGATRDAVEHAAAEPRQRRVWAASSGSVWQLEPGQQRQDLLREHFGITCGTAFERRKAPLHSDVA
jgi:hypothetical protein